VGVVPNDDDYLKALHRDKDCTCPVCETHKLLAGRLKSGGGIPIGRTGPIYFRVLIHLMSNQLNNMTKENQDAALETLARDLTSRLTAIRERQKPKH
jgi:hypothetical protein